MATAWCWPGTSGLDTIQQTRLGPTIAARALAVVHTAIYDAWAAYDPAAVPTMANGNGRRLSAERTVANKNKAVSFAAYAALVDLFPGRQPIYAQHMVNDLGYAVGGADTSPAAMVGSTAAQAVLDYRHHGGANQLGDEPGGTPAVAYSDYTGYRPVNTWTGSTTSTAGSRCAHRPHRRVPSAAPARSRPT